MSARPFQVGDRVRVAQHYGHRVDSRIVECVVTELAPAYISGTGVALPARLVSIVDDGTCVASVAMTDDFTAPLDPARATLSGTAGDEVVLLEAAPTVARPDALIAARDLAHAAEHAMVALDPDGLVSKELRAALDAFRKADVR